MTNGHPTLTFSRGEATTFHIYKYVEQYSPAVYHLIPSNLMLSINVLYIPRVLVHPDLYSAYILPSSLVDSYLYTCFTQSITHLNLDKDFVKCFVEAKVSSVHSDHIS